MTGADQAVHVADVREQSGLQVTDQDAELLDPVLHRGTGEEQDADGGPGPLPDGLGAFGVHVLGVVGLVDDQQAEVHSRGLGQ